MTVNEKIAATCRALRAMRGLKQRELGELLGVTEQTVRRIESGRVNTQRYIFPVAQATRVTLGEFNTLMDIVVNSEARSK